MKRGALAAGFLLFIALCASLAYWGMQLFKPPARQVAAAPQATQIDIRPETAAALFGGRPTALAAAVNYQLKGVVVAGSPNESVAILIPEGKPAKAVGVNSEIMPGVVVKEVHPKYVIVSEGGVSKKIELPAVATSGGSAEMGLASTGGVIQLGAPPGAAPGNMPAPAEPPPGIVVESQPPQIGETAPVQTEQPPPPSDPSQQVVNPGQVPNAAGQVVNPHQMYNPSGPPPGAGMSMRRR